MSIPQITNNTNSPSRYAAIIQNNPICQLPIDLFFRILKFLDPPTVDNLCSLTCKQFKIILSDTFCNRIWKDLFCIHFPNAEINNIENFRLSYKDKAFIISNIKNTVCSSNKISDQGNITNIIIDDKGRLLLTDINNSIKICNPISRECINTISMSNNSYIFALAASNGRLYAGFDHGKIEVFDITTGLSLNTLQSSHTSYCLSSLTVIGKNLIAVYKDRSIEILNIKEIETRGIEYQKTILKDINLSDFTSSLITPDGKYVSGNYCLASLGASFSYIEIKDLVSQKSIATLSVHHRASIVSLACANERLYVGLSTGEIKIIDLKSLQHVASLAINIPEEDTVFFPSNLAMIDGHLYVDYIILFDCIFQFDFTTTHDLVFEEIAEHLMNPRWEKVIQNAMERFSRMPRSAKNRVYEELYLLLKPENHYWGWGEHAFHDQYQLSCPREKKGLAILNYLASLKSEEVNPPSLTTSTAMSKD